MLGKRQAIIVVAFFAFLIFFTGCQSTSTSGDVLAAAASGLIVPPGATEIRGWQPNMVEVQRRNIERSVTVPVTPHLPLIYTLNATTSGSPSTFWITNAAPGTFVEEGELLVQKLFEGNLFDEIAREMLLMEIQTFDSNFNESRRNRERQVEDLRNSLSGAEGSDYVLLNLQLRHSEMQLERFIFDNRRTRQGLQERLDDLTRPFEPIRVYAPFDGIILSNTGATNQNFHNWIINIADHTNLSFSAVSTSDILRHGVVYPVSVYQLEDFLFYIYMKVVSDHFANSRAAAVVDFTLRPLIDIDISDIVNATSFRIYTNDVLVYNALVLPNHAIRPENRLEYVLLYENGNFIRRYVSRGLQFGGSSQILIGLSEGMVVVLP